MTESQKSGATIARPLPVFVVGVGVKEITIAMIVPTFDTL